MSEEKANTIVLHLNEKTDLVSFLETVKQCKQDVLLKTAEGDVLNLKSTLSQYLFAAISDRETVLKNIAVCCAKEDMQRLKCYCARP